jgi:hypothetical protein
VAHIQADRVKETTTTTGTGNVTLAGAVAGFRTFAAMLANDDTCFYCIAGQSGSEWEVGLGTFVSATPALARTTVLQSSNAGAAVNFSAGTKDVFITVPAQRLFLPDLAGDPSAPSGGGCLVYTKSQAGRFVPRFVGPSGIDSGVQPCLWGNTVVMWLPGTGTTTSIAFGVSWTVSATQAHPTIADTNIMTRIMRATYTTTTTAGNASGVRSTAPIAIRNNGFFFVARWGILTYTSTMQAWCGLGAASGNIAGDPSAANNSCGMSKDTGETTWQVFTRDASTTSKTSTGRTTAAAANAEIFDVYMFCKPADSKITFRVVDVGTGTVVLANTEKSTNLPVSSTVLYAHCEVRNQAGGAGSAVAIFLNKLYMEADQ